MNKSIDAVEILARDPGFCRFQVNGRWLDAIRRDDAERLGVRVGTRWTPTLAAKVARLIEVASARRAALSMLARATLSRERLLERLESRGHAAKVAERALDELHDDGWLNDRTAAIERAAAVARRGNMALEALQTQLEDEGFKRDARAAARKALAGQSDLERAIAEARKTTVKRRSGASIARRLSRCGFDSDTIEQVLDRLGITLEPNDHARSS